MRFLSLSFPTFRRLYCWWRERLSAGGKALVLALLWLVGTTINSEQSETPLLSACLAICLVTWIANRIFWPRLNIQVRGPAQAMCGRAIAIGYDVLNNSRWSAYSLSLRPLGDAIHWESNAPATLQPELAPRSTVPLTATVRPLRRGIWAWPGVQAGSSFPFNVWRSRQHLRATTEVAVYPHYDDDHVADVADALAQHSGLDAAHISRASTGSDFFGNREYQPGMPVRRWNYSAWARLGQPIVREFQEPRSQRAAVFVDADLSGEPLEELLSSAAALCDHLLAEQWSLDLFVMGATTLGNALDSLVLGDVLDSLARAMPNQAVGRERWSRKLSQDHVAFLLLSRWDGKRAALAQIVQEDCGGVVALRLDQGRLSLSSHLVMSEVHR